jgi:hypothetical protein
MTEEGTGHHGSVEADPLVAESKAVAEAEDRL